MDPQQGAPPADILIGQTVGNYLVTQKLGEGGMGSVYLAEHPTIGKKVALKVLHAEFSTNPEVADRFFTEAKAVNAIGHPNIVDIVDYGVIQTGRGASPGTDRLVYFIMEYLSGVTLSQVIRAEAPMPPERALMIALQVADALAASHKCGIVHRDLKPDNIILISRGRERDFVKLLDFGIAKLTGSDGMSSHKTRTGLVLGTPAYMSPEQCEGRATVDHRTDVYALGICLYEMLTGRVPFIGEGYGEILVQHLTQPPVAPSQYRMMSPHVEAVVLKALEKRPELRYPTMDEFIRAMSDPVGYVEAHGGVGGFLQRQLMPSSAPLPMTVRLTPAPLTPAPGLMSPVPGTLRTPTGVGAVGAQTPTTLSSAAGQAGAQGGKSKTGFIIAGVAVAAAAAVGIVLVAKGGKKSTPAADNSGSATGSEVVMNNGSAGSATPTPDKGSAATGSAAGSATVPTVPDKGSAAGSAVASTGSATGSAAGSAAVGSAAGSATVTPPEVKMTKLVLSSVPEGAEIFINGVDMHKKTNATLTVPRIKDHAQIRLHLSGYEDVVFKDIALDAGDSVEKAANMKKLAVTQQQGQQGKGQQGKGQQGKGSATKACDTCLERPD